MNQKTTELILRHTKRINKKLAGKSPDLIILQKRTLNTAAEIMNNLDNIDFKHISMSLYFYCEDVRMNQFTQYYEAQVELAGANPERFITHLHRFFQDISHKIKKENLFSEFMEFAYRCHRLTLSYDGKTVKKGVVDAYTNLLLQTKEYLRPDKFDYSVSFAGRTTQGDSMVIKDPYPLLDVPGYDLEPLLNTPGVTRMSIQRTIHSTYKKYGYDVWDFDDINFLGNNDKVYTYNIFLMMAFINEFTYDILPSVPMNTRNDIFLNLTANYPLDELYAKLAKRKRTLPSNGATINIERGTGLKTILLKEIYFDDSIFMLYKICTNKGDISGYYDTKGRFFYSVLLEDGNDPAAAKSIATFILFLYGSHVLNDADIMTANLPRYFTSYGEPIEARGVLHGGKLQDQYHREGIVKIGNEDYTTESRTIQGYVRKLPEGQQASEKARALAQSLGFDLDEGTTYVQPFEKQVFKLKRKED